MSSETEEESYIDKRVKEFQNYFQKELQILNHSGVTYYIAYDFLDKTIERLKLFIAERAPFPIEGEPQSEKERGEYLRRVSGIISKQARNFESRSGSFWGDVGEKLNDLATSVKSDDLEQIER